MITSTASFPTCPIPPARSEGEERFETLVRLRFEADRRTLEAARVRQAMIWFAALWCLVPVIDAVVLTQVSPLATALHLGLVIPWALLVVGRADGRPSRVSLDVLAGGVAATAVAVTLIAHRLDPDPTASALDLIAVLPILHLCLSIRPRRDLAIAVVAGGLVALWSAILGRAAPDAAAIGPLLAASGAAVIALAAGQAMEEALKRSHLARLRSDLAAHRLIHRNDELRVLSEVDTLTGLANRRSIDLRLPEIAERSLGEAETVAVMMIDVDHFKAFNDRFGHPEGDRCLAAVARATAAQIRRKDDLIGRFGGEEFLVVLPGAGLEVAMQVAERIRVAIERLAIRQSAGCGSKVVTVSIGCSAGVVTDARAIEDLLRDADVELYAAKRCGRNRVSPPLGDGIAANPTAPELPGAA